MIYRFTDVVIDSRTGLNPRKNFVLGGGDNYYITIKDIYNGKVNLTDKTDKVDDEAIQIIKRRSRIKAGDVLFVSIGRIGETAIVTNKDDSWDVNESVFVFTLNDKIITPEYFCTMFQSQGVKQYLSGNSSGSTFKSIKMNQLERMTFDLPPVTTQKSITTKLTAVRRIIDLRTSQLAELNNLVKARFVELFGDPISNPHGFDKVDLSELADIKIGPFGSLLHKGDYIEGGYALLNPSHIIDGKIAPDSELTVSREKYEELSAYHLKAGDVVMGRRGEMGRCAVVPCDGYLCGTGSLLIRTKGDVTADYIQKIISFPSFKKAIEDMAVGQTMPNLNVPIVSRFQIIKPPIEVQHSYYAFVEQTDKSKVAVQKSLDEAQLLFDSLMQQYFG